MTTQTRHNSNTLVRVAALLNAKGVDMESPSLLCLVRTRTLNRCWLHTSAHATAAPPCCDEAKVLVHSMINCCSRRPVNASLQLLFARRRHLELRHFCRDLLANDGGGQNNAAPISTNATDDTYMQDSMREATICNDLSIQTRPESDQTYLRKLSPARTGRDESSGRSKLFRLHLRRPCLALVPVFAASQTGRRFARD